MNSSEFTFTPAPEGIRFGLGGIKNVGANAVEEDLCSRGGAGGISAAHEGDNVVRPFCRWNDCSGGFEADSDSLDDDRLVQPSARRRGDGGVDRVRGAARRDRARASIRPARALSALLREILGARSLRFAKLAAVELEDPIRSLDEISIVRHHDHRAKSPPSYAKPSPASS